MRRKVAFGLVLVGLFVLGTVAVLAADEDVITPRAGQGPHFKNVMVARRDVGTGGPVAKPPVPGKPIPIVDAVGTGRGVSGHSPVGGGLSSGSITPEMSVENSMKSLASELR